MPQLQFADDSHEEEQGPGGLPLAEVFQALLGRRWLIALCVAVAVAVAGSVSWRTPPVSRATSLLELERERSNPIETGMVPSRESGPDAEGFATQAGASGIHRVLQTHCAVARMLSLLTCQPLLHFIPHLVADLSSSSVSSIRLR